MNMAEEAKVFALEAELKSWKESFELYDKAIRRGTEKWRNSPGNPYDVLPDTSMLVAWMVDQLEAQYNVLKIVAIAMDLQAGDQIDEDAFKRVQKRYGGGMAGAYINVCEALGTCRVRKTDEQQCMHEKTQSEHCPECESDESLEDWSDIQEDKLTNAPGG